MNTLWCQEPVQCYYVPKIVKLFFAAVKDHFDRSLVHAAYRGIIERMEGKKNKG